MAGFCGNCGKPLGDEDRVCGNCGTVVSGKMATTGNSDIQKNVGNTKNTGSKRITYVVAAIIGVVALVIASNVIKSNTGYNATIKKMVKAFADYDMPALLQLTSEVSDEIYGQRYSDLEDYYDDRVSDSLDVIEERVGTIKSISYEITDFVEFSERKLNGVKDELIDRYHLDVDGIKQIVQVDLKLTVKGNRKNSSYNVDSLILIKENGGWKLFYGTLPY